MLDQLQVPLGPRRSIGDTYHYHVRSTSKVPLGPKRSIGDTYHYHVRSTSRFLFKTQKIDRRYTPLSCQINSRFLWDPEDRQEIHTITMLDQLQVPLGPKRSIGDTYYYHVRSTLGSFGTMLDQLQVPLGCRRSIGDTYHHHVRSIQQVPLGRKRSIGDTHHYHVRSTQVPLRPRRSIGDTHHYHVRSTLGSFGTQKIDRRYTPLPCQINSRLLWDPEDQQETHTINMLDQLQVPLGPRRSIGDTYHYHVRSTLGSFGTQKIDRRYTPLPCQINFRFLWDPEDRQEIHTITMLDQLQVPLRPKKIDRRYTPLPCQINFSVL